MFIRQRRNNSMAFILLLILVIAVLINTGCTSTENKNNYTDIIAEEEQQIEESSLSNYVTVKYKNDPVDIGDPRFEYLDTTGSEFIFGAWYDDEEQYMVINLNGTYYYYCGMPESVWNDFKNAETFGGFYNKWIKGNYACN